MPTVWFNLKRTLQCKSEPQDVYDPKSKKDFSSIITKKSATSSRSGCSRSISNLKDVIHGSKRHLDRPPSSSPRSIGSNEFLNPITHEVILNNSKCELKISSGYGCNGGGVGNSTFMGTVAPGTPGPGWHHQPSQYLGTPGRVSTAPSRKPSSLLNGGSRGSSRLGGSSIFSGVNTSKESSRFGGSSIFGGGSASVVSKPRISHDGSTVSCHKCGEQFGRWEAVEAHHLSKHAVTELVEGDSSRKIVEKICRTSWVKSENILCRFERVLKVHNMQKTMAKFEEYRETIKIKASKLPNKHSRCLADGNELLRFFGTTIVCSLGMSGSSSLCISEKCCVCRVLRHGFSARKELKGGIGVFTTSTSGRALEKIKLLEENPSVKKALIVCRVIAGRVHRPLDNFQEFTDQSGFDSVAGKVGLHSKTEELYLLNPKALLPCFVVICKP